jgi:hypothetical protein
MGVITAASSAGPARSMQVCTNLLPDAAAHVVDVHSTEECCLPITLVHGLPNPLVDMMITTHSAPEDGGVDKAWAYAGCYDAPVLLVAVLQLPCVQDVAGLAASILREPAGQHQHIGLAACHAAATYCTRWLCKLQPPRSVMEEQSPPVTVEQPG